MSTPDADWTVFQSHASILDFSLGVSNIDQVVQKFGGELPKKPNDNHDLVSICIKDPRDVAHLVFTTGVLHDYSTLYGFQISPGAVKKNQRECQSWDGFKADSISTRGGLYLGQTQENVLKLLKDPTKKDSQSWTWNYAHYLGYSTPQTSVSEAGPTDSRYLMKFISKGAHESGSIEIRFSRGKVTNIAVWFFSESDFYIEHYDIKTGEKLDTRR